MNISSSGNFDNLTKWLKRVTKGGSASVDYFASTIVRKLQQRTPTRSGKTAQSWSYNITQKNGAYEIEIINTNINKNVSVAKLIHYGHGTGTGGWVEGTHFITETIDPIYKQNINKILSEMVK